MRAVVLVGLALVAAASGFEAPLRGYHEAVGIPEAARIKAEEERVLANNNSSLFDERIVGGAVAPINSHPYLGGLIISFWNILGNSVCGSSLISQNRLVTAAHCWFDGTNQASQFLVVLGSHLLFSGGTRISTSNVIMHPQYSPVNLNNDVAVIHLPNSVFYTASIQAIALPSGIDLFDTFAGQWATAAGYGKTSDAQIGVSVNTVVSQVNLQVITYQQCAAEFGTVFVVPSTICTNGRSFVGVCGGDSGGPLVVQRSGRPTLVGISSFVAAVGCQMGYHSAFARVTSFNGFIQQHM